MTASVVGGWTPPAAISTRTPRKARTSMPPHDSGDQPAGSADGPALASDPLTPAVGEAPRTFDKPNLQVRDPDPYAFANRIWRLTLTFALLVVIAAGPYIAGRFWYHIRYNQMKADYQASTEGLEGVRARLSDFTLASRMVAKKVGPSVVNIYTPSRRGPDGQGSGVVMDEAGYVLTNFHVVQNAAELRVQLADGRNVPATVVGADPAMDLAVMKIDAGGLVAAEWGDSETLELGDLVWALGSPFGLSRSITFGIVSAKHRGAASGVLTSSVYQEYLQTDVAINPGNSGGPLVDLEGKVVGINTAILGESYRGVSFAIPAQLAQEKYAQLRDVGFVRRGYLGVEPSVVPERLRRRLDLENGQGVFVADVIRDGPASLGGLRRGDVIMQWNDHLARNPTELSRTIAGTEIGSTATVLVKRVERGEVVERTLAVEVGLKPFADAKDQQGR